MTFPDYCPQCGSDALSTSGVGTQKIEVLIKELYPNARVERIDSDILTKKNAHIELLGKFQKGEIDILVGTQMIAKGLDFENVTLVGVLLIDRSLYAGDYLGYEKTFSLITQVVGRCGRADKPGRAYIQTYSPENRVIEFAEHQNYEAFFEYELTNRRIMLYPPFCDICAVGFTGEREQEVVDCAKGFVSRLGGLAGGMERMPLRVIGPTPSAVVRVGNRFRYKVIIKCVNNSSFRSLMKSALTGLETPRGVTVYADSSFSGMI